MTFETWQEFYYAGWQWPWALMLAPFAFLLHRLASGAPEAAGESDFGRFVARYGVWFALLTMLDPIVTGPLTKLVRSESFAQGAGLVFVLLGDFRVYWLVMRGASEDGGIVPFARSLALMLVVPVVAYGLVLGLNATGGESSAQVLYLTHELLFLGVALLLARVFVPRWVDEPGRAAYLRSVLGYVAAYYGLWALADAMILAGLDQGWWVRCIPNQLYYALFIPFISARYFADPDDG
jgi:hypothetical protein